MTTMYSTCALPLDYATSFMNLLARAERQLRYCLEQEGCADIVIQEPKFQDGYIDEDGTEIEPCFLYIATGVKA